MPRGFPDDIPWRRSDVESLHRFLKSAYDRVDLSDSSNELFKNSDNSSESTPAFAETSFNTKPKSSSEINYGSVSKRRDSSKSFARRDKIKVPYLSNDSPETFANICILRGQTGCGKTTAVRLLSETIGLKVIEYDPFESDVVYISDNGTHDAVAATFLRFLDTVRRKPGICVSQKNTVYNREIAKDVTSNRLKRPRLALLMPTAGSKSHSDTSSTSEPHIILLKDLPRTLITNKTDCSRRIQEITNSILDGEGTSNGITKYPMLICVNNTASDRQLLRSILPYNFKQHPRCMILQVGQITKSKLRAILYRHLDFWGRGRTRQNEMLIDFLTSASCGDMRYAIANLHFYSSVNRTSSKNTGDEMEVLSRLLLERNPSNAVFNVIGKVLVNKRIPVILDDSECDITEDNVLGPSEQGVNSLERFRHCFQLSAPLRVSDCDKEGAVLSLPDDYSDILEILPNLCANISEELLTFEVATESQGDLPPPCSEMLWENMFRSLYENHFDTQLWADMPTDVRLYGLLKPFNKSEPLSFCRWPVIQATPNVEPCRFPRSSHLPLLTRPQMYYNPDELVKNSSIDSVFLVDSLHENYSSYYESIEDCAALTAQLCAADVFASGYRHAGIIGDDLLDDVNTRFACICVRSTSHSNLGGSGVSTQFRAFTKGTWHSESKHDMNHLKDLYDQHIRDLASGNQVTSKSITSAYMCKNRAFVELVPFIYMFMYSVPGKHDADMPLFGHIDDVISQPIWERINMIMDEQPCSAPEQMKSNATMPVGMLSSITPKLKEVLSELSKHYDSNFTHVQT